MSFVIQGSISIFVVYMNVLKATRFPPPHHVMTNFWAWRNYFFAWHQEVGFWYFILLFIIPFTGTIAYRWKHQTTNNLHALVAFSLISLWIISTMASNVALIIAYWS